MLGRQREQHARCVVLDGALAEPGLKRRRGRAVEDLVSEVLAYAREVIDPGPGPGAVLEQLVRGRVALPGEEPQRCGCQSREIVGDEPQESQRAQLDRQTKA